MLFEMTLSPLGFLHLDLGKTNPRDSIYPIP